jgi:hypothetical protein
MIDKPFLENELKRLGDHYQTVQKQAYDLANLLQQFLGAMQVLRGLLGKVETDAPVIDVTGAVSSSED